MKAISICFNLEQTQHAYIYIYIQVVGLRSGRSLPMSSWCYEVEAAVYTSILQNITDHSRLFIQILLIFRVNVVNDGKPTVHIEQSMSSES